MYICFFFIYNRCIHLYFCARWHDAGTYDAKSKTGGPNGSIRNEEEFTHGANNGLKIALDFCGNPRIFIVQLHSLYFHSIIITHGVVDLSLSS